jgi:hypothetical protein
MEQIVVRRQTSPNVSPRRGFCLGEVSAGEELLIELRRIFVAARLFRGRCRLQVMLWVRNLPEEYRGVNTEGSHSP